MSSDHKGAPPTLSKPIWLQHPTFLQAGPEPLASPAGYRIRRDMRMASWLELFLNIIGYGGFIAVASLHRPAVAEESAPRVHDDSGDVIQ